MEEKYEKIDLNFFVLDFSTSYIESKLRQIEESSQVNLEEKTMEASQLSKKLEKNKNIKNLVNKKPLDPISIMKLKAERTKRLMKNFKELRDFMLCYSSNTVNSDERRKNFTLKKDDLSINFHISKKITKEFNLDFFKDRFIADNKFNAICVLDNEQDIRNTFPDQYENYRKYYNDCLLKTKEFFKGNSKQVILFSLREYVDKDAFNEVTEELFIIPLNVKGLKNNNIANDTMNARIWILKFIDYIVKEKAELENNINPYYSPKVKASKINTTIKVNKININSKSMLKNNKNNKDNEVNTNTNTNFNTEKNNNKENHNDNDDLNNLNVDKIKSKEINLHETDYEKNIKEEINVNKHESNYSKGKKASTSKVKLIGKVSCDSIYNYFKEKKYFKTPYQVYKFSFSSNSDTKEKKSKKKAKKNDNNYTSNNNSVKENCLKNDNESINPKFNLKENTKVNGSKIHVSNIIKMGNDQTNQFYLIGCNKKSFLKVNNFFEVQQELSFSNYTSTKVNTDLNTNNTNQNNNNFPNNLELITPLSLTFAIEKKKILLLTINSNSTNYQVDVIGTHDQVIQLKKLSENYLASLSHFACIKVFNIPRKEQVKYYKLYSLIEARNCFFELNLEYFIYTDLEYTKIFDINQDKIIDSFKNITPVVYFSKVNPYLNVFIQINFDATYTLLSVDYTKNKRYLSTNYYSKEVFFSLDKLEKGKGYDFSFDIDSNLLKTAFLEMHQLFLVNTGRAVIINHFYFEEQNPKLKFLCFLQFETPIYNWILDNHFATILGENYFEENRSVNFESIIL